LRHCILKENAALRQGVEVRRFDIRVTIAIQVIRTQRVYGDDNDVERLQALRIRSGGFSAMRGAGSEESRETCQGR
jgi:hypothetical protein